MEQVKSWAIGEFKKHMPIGIFQDDELKVMFENLTQSKEK